MANMPEQRPFRSKQDVGTPRQFLDAVEKRFGKIEFDLAAHKNNKVCENYLAPKELVGIYNKEIADSTLIEDLVLAGGDRSMIEKALSEARNIKDSGKIIIPNTDTDCFGKDSLNYDWSTLPFEGNYWLNPEYEDIEKWVTKCYESSVAMQGPIFCLIPASTGTTYFFNFIHNKAKIFMLSPRIKFVGHTTPYPRDLILIGYGLEPGYECWQWKQYKKPTHPCTRCGSSERYKRSASGGGGGCVTCGKLKAEEWRKKQKAGPNAEAFQENRNFVARLNRYQITKDEYENLLKIQNYKCAICKINSPDYIDHDHSCCSADLFKLCGNCNRGVLCINCNWMLGHAKDNIQNLLEGAEYLKRYFKN